jgi:hypothetical protein
MKKKDKEYKKKLEVYIDKAKLREKYALERYDILIISLSSGGIALSVTFFEKFNGTDKSTVFVASILFSIALVVNLLSQITGYYANNFDIKYTVEEIREIEKKDFYLDYKKYDCYKSIFNVLTNVFNLVSLLGLITGLIFLILFIKQIK